MYSITRAGRRRSLWLASTLLIPLSPFAIPAAYAQQSASPDLLPPVEVSPPKPAPQPVKPKPSRRQAVAKPAAQKPPEQPATPKPGVANSTTNVVSPTGVVTPINQVASSVTVITAQDIATQQYRTVPDALNTVPGLNVVQTGGPGGQTAVFIRGTNSNHTKVLVDGIDIGDPGNFNGAFDFAHLLTFDMAQIEVLRGPQSGLYGSDAIGGVISIITQKGEGPARWTATNEAGSFGTFNQSIGVSGSQDNYNYAASVSHVHASDVPVTPLQLLPAGQQAIGNNYDNMTYSTKTGINLSDSLALNSVLRYTEATLLFTGTNTFDPINNTFVPDAQQSQHTVHQFFGREEAVWSLLDGRIKNYFGVNYTNYWNSDITPGVDLTTITTGNRLKYDWHSVTEVATGQNLIVGAERENSEINTTGLSAQTGNTAGFIEWQSKFANRFFLTANIREDDNDNFGDHMTYRIAPAVILPVTDTTIKASYGTGFKAPSLNQLFESIPGFVLANPNLKPEQSRGADIGFEQPLFNDRIRFGSTYFKNNITDLIDSVVLPGGVFQNVNIDNAITEGTESFVTFNVIDRVKIRADYTVTRAVDAATGSELLRRPKEKFSVTTIWNPIDPLTLSATALRVGDWVDFDRAGDPTTIVAPGYTVVNLRADYAINDQLKVFGRIDNVANVHYQNPTGFLAPGLGVFGGIRFASYGVK